MERIIALVLTLLCLTTGIAGEAAPIRVGVSVALSGRYAPMGEMYTKGLRLWEKEVNSKGGILGRPVELIIHDDHSSPEEARVIYQRMLTRDRVDFVFGPYSSGISKAIVPIVENHHYPILLPLAASDAPWANGPKYVFGLHTPERRWSSTILTFLARHGIERVCILVDEKLFRLGTPEGAAKWAKRLALKIVLREVLDPRGVDTQLQRARNLGVEALLVWGYMDDAVMVRRALDQMGWRPKVYFSQASAALDEYRRVLGPLADNTVGISLWEPTAARLYPGARRFLQAFRTEYGLQPTYHAAMGFAAGEVMEEAISRVGAIDRERVRNELATLDMVTVVGRYGVDRRGVQERHRPLIIQWQDGKKKVLWPEGLSDGRLRFPTERHP